MSSAAFAFQQQVGGQLCRALGSRYKFFKSRIELRAQSGDGDNVLVLAGSNKYSPYISLEFYFGRNYAAAKRIERLLGDVPFYYHVQQYSLNRKHMNGLAYSGPYTWSLDIRQPINSLIPEMILAVQGMADPFFQRFYSIESARNAIAAADSWCFGGRVFWKQLLLLDAAMNELEHFKSWARHLDDFRKSQAEREIQKLARLGIL